MTIPVKVKRLNKYALLPERGSAAAAGYDIFACLDEPIKVGPHETVKIPSGLAFQIPDNYMMGIYARSGLATKQGLRPSNCVGVVDSDYRGAVIVALHNDSEFTRTIEPHEKIAQLIIMPFLTWELEEVNELSETERGTGGFGSTGK